MIKLTETVVIHLRATQIVCYEQPLRAKQMLGPLRATIMLRVYDRYALRNANATTSSCYANATNAHLRLRVTPV